MQLFKKDVKEYMPFLYKCRLFIYLSYYPPINILARPNVIIPSDKYVYFL